jgi:hypothetical protein
MLIDNAPRPTGGRLIGQAFVTVMHHGRVTDLSRRYVSANPRQAVDGALDLTGGTAAWVETSSTDLGNQDWVVFANHHGKMARLGTSAAFLGPGLASLPMPAGVEHSMATDGSQVWWSYTLPWKDPGPVVTNIAVAPADGATPPRRVVEHGKLPVADRGRLLYVRDVTVEPRLEGHFEIRSLDAAGKDTLVHRGDTGSGIEVADLCSGSGVLAWTIATRKDDPGGRLFVQDRKSGRIASIQLRDGGLSTSMGCGDDFVTWGNGSGSGDASQYLATTDGRLFRLGSSPGISAVYAAGRYSAWTIPPTAPQEPASTRIVRWP